MSDVGCGMWEGGLVISAMHATSDRESRAAPDVRLRRTAPGDLDALFEMQSDAESNDMAGTKARPRDVFFALWEKLFADANLRSRVIEVVGPGGEAAVVGSIGCFQADGVDCIGYWIARPHWGKGIASRAVALFLEEGRRRPLHATADRKNAASCRILEKCGFRCTGVRMGEETERFVAREVAEFVLEG